MIRLGGPRHSAEISLAVRLASELAVEDKDYAMALARLREKMDHPVRLRARAPDPTARSTIRIR
jgi:hypothetical protein